MSPSMAMKPTCLPGCAKRVSKQTFVWAEGMMRRRGDANNSPVAFPRVPVSLPGAGAVLTAYRLFRHALTALSQSTTSMILPTLRLSSMYLCAAAGANEVSIIGRMLPFASSGNQRSRKRCVMAILFSRA